MKVQLNKEQQIMSILFHTIQEMKSNVKSLEKDYYTRLSGVNAFSTIVQKEIKEIYMQIAYLTKNYKELERIYYSRNGKIQMNTIFDTEKEADKFIKKTNPFSYIKLAFNDPEENGKLRWFVKYLPSLVED